MRMIKRMMAGLAMALALGGAALADPVEGLWQTEPGDNGGFIQVAIAPCGEAFCGVIRSAFDKQGKPDPGYEHLGKRMLWDMKPEGGGKYGEGKIWAPDRGKTYNSKMQLSGNRLEVEGCVFFICRGQSWTRVK